MATRRFRVLRALLIATVSVVLCDVLVSLTLIRDGRFLGQLLPPTPGLAAKDLEEWLADQHRLLADASSATTVAQFDAELGWVTRVNYTPTGDLRTNSIGARGTREYAARPPEGTLRIATFGDSFIFGNEVKNADTFQARMEELRSNVEAINLGVSGYGQDQALLRFRRSGRELGARVVCFGLMLENIGRNVNRARHLLSREVLTPTPKPRFLLENGELRLLRQPFATHSDLIAAVEAGSLTSALAEHEYWSDPDLPSFAWASSFVRIGAGFAQSRKRSVSHQWLDREGEPFRVTLALIAAFHAEARAAGIEHPMVLIFGMKSDIEARASGKAPYWRTLLDELDRRQIPYLDTSKAIADAARAAGSVDGLFERVHLSRAGQELVAHALLDYLDAHDVR